MAVSLSFSYDMRIEAYTHASPRFIPLSPALEEGGSGFKRIFTLSHPDAPLDGDGRYTNLFSKPSDAHQGPKYDEGSSGYSRQSSFSDNESAKNPYTGADSFRQQPPTYSPESSYKSANKNWTSPQRSPTHSRQSSLSKGHPFFGWDYFHGVVLNSPLTSPPTTPRYSPSVRSTVKSEEPPVTSPKSPPPVRPPPVPVRSTVPEIVELPNTPARSPPPLRSTTREIVEMPSTPPQPKTPARNAEDAPVSPKPAAAEGENACASST